MNLQDQMFKAVNTLKSKYPTAGVVITGHSLGAAMATFAAAAIKTTYNFDRFTFYTFGSPRVGNKVFSDYIFNLFPDGEYSRITHYNDMVVHVPAHFMSFQHAGDEVFYEHANDLSHRTCHNSAGASDENQACANSMWATGIEAHLNYLGRPICSAACLNGGPFLPAKLYQNGTIEESDNIEFRFLSE